MGHWKNRWIQTPQRILMDPCIKQAPVWSKWFWIILWPLAYNRLELDSIRKIYQFLIHFWMKMKSFRDYLAVLETAGRTVAKCDQTLVWATKFFPKDHPENEFGRPNLGRGYRMFSAYLRSISVINIFKTDQRTWGNNIVFLPKEVAIILIGSLRFSATCCLILFSKKTFSRTRLTL